MKTRAWKITRDLGKGGLVSSTMTGWLLLRYAIGETTQPFMGPLFGFPTLEVARKFAHSGNVILEGTGILAEIQEYRELPSDPETWETLDLAEFWRGECSAGDFFWNVTPDTIFLSEFTPLRIVEKED